MTNAHWNCEGGRRNERVRTEVIDLVFSPFREAVTAKRFRHGLARGMRSLTRKTAAWVRRREPVVSKVRHSIAVWVRRIRLARRPGQG